jgi:hypothetical protein
MIDAPPLLSRARALKPRIARELRGYPNVTGVGVGYRRVRGRRTDQVCIRVYVRRKLPRNELRAQDVLPEAVEGVPIDVIEARFKAHQDGVENRQHFNPLVGGIIIGNPASDSFGTLGVSVFDNVLGEDMILSNWHVLCGRSDCRPGEPIVPGVIPPDVEVKRENIIQENAVARLHRFALTDEVDAATARLNGYRFLLKSVFQIGSVEDIATAALGMAVWKSGARTGLTPGVVSDVDGDFEIDYSEFGMGDRDFNHQLVIEGDVAISLAGDSGSVWVDDSNRVVGLNFAGDDDGKQAIANPIGAVLEALNINLRVGITMHGFVAITTNVLL